MPCGAYDRVMGLLRRGVATICLLLLAAGCTARADPPPGPVVLSWREITLPGAPAGERIELRAAAVCAGHWYLTGAYADVDDANATRPAAWTSTDGQAWTALPVAASSAYGPQHELYTAACHDGRLVALGQKPGGAHGNPRVSSYHLVPNPDGTETLTEVPASLTLYGGGDGINVGRLSSIPGAAIGPHDGASSGSLAAVEPPAFLATGNRRLGAAVWLSPDGAAPFDLVEGAPTLATGDGPVTWAMDSAYVDGSWVVVGATAASALNRDAASWRSPDGRAWTRVATQAGADYDELNAVTPTDGGAVAVGANGDTFQAWALDSTGWKLAGRFGDTGLTEAGAVPAIAGVAAAGGMVLAVVVGPDPYGLWSSVDGGATWRPGALPPADTGARFVALTATGGGFLLTADDGTGAHAYLATPEGV